MKRKNIILFALLLLLLSNGQLWAQKETSPYKPMAEFNGDTARYLEFNYAVRKVQYRGWMVGDILQELEFPVLYIAETIKISPTDGPTKLVGLGLGIRKTGRHPSIMKDYYIVVCFENPPAIDEYIKVSGRTANNPFPPFTPKLYDFIKDMKVTGVSFNPQFHVIFDPDLLEKMKRIHEEIDRGAREARERYDRRILNK
jgi:hypothetical protein